VAPANSTATDIASFGTVATNQPVLASSRSINGVTFTATNAVTLSGAGTLTVGASGINNTSASGLKSVSLALTLAATQSFTNAGSLTLSGPVNNGGFTLTLAGTGTGGTLSGNISGSGGLTKSGTGTWIVSGNNSYTGQTLIQGGTLSINTLGNVGGGASALGAPTTTAKGTIGIGSSTTTGTLQYTGTGSTSNRVINLAGTTGGATIDASGSGALVFTSALTATGAGSKTLTLTGSSTAANTMGGAIVNNSGTNVTSLVKSGAGSWTLSGTAANTYTGATTVNSGTLNLNKTAGVNAVGTGTVTIGDGSGSASSAHIVLLASNQIANTVAVTLNSDGRLALNNFSDTINTIAGTGLIDLATSGYLTIGGNNGSSTFGGSVTGDGTLEKAGTGSLTFNSSLDFTGTLTLSGGTLALNGYNLTVGTLHITGNTILDFGNSSASILNATNFVIDAGFTLTVNNWANAVDFFYAQNNPGGTQGAVPLNQITFTGSSASDTKWQSYDHQITPAPEPAVYGAVLTGCAALLLGWRRRRAVRG
jgi:autotransporter-associated beta strand protein